MNLIINLSYLVASIFFVFGLKLLNAVKTAKKGNFLSALGMLIAILVTFLDKDIIEFKWIIVGLILGSLIGIIFAQKVLMTKMPEMVALLNGFGGIASLLVGFSVYNNNVDIGFSLAFSIFLSILIGGITFTGSLMAWAKLSEKISGKPITFSYQTIFNFLILFLVVAVGVMYSLYPKTSYSLLIAIIIASNLLGILFVMPVGGADMPVIISLLNSYSGLAACASGFVIKNNILIISGALVGASGIILTIVMCKAMNRSIVNVLFGKFGLTKSSNKENEKKETKSLSAEEVYYVLEAAKEIVIVPGYGLAVAQAQHIVKELCDILEKNDANVSFAIHPVAGRMPGHMNVLLAEADISYDKLIEMDEVNKNIDKVDVCLIIGANDVVNPAARDDQSSSIYGMPIIEADRAKNVFILKRSMASGFAGIENPLFFKENATMVFGDAKKTLQTIVDSF